MQNKLEKALVEHASPTLAGIKVAGLFRYTPEMGEDAEKTVGDGNAGLVKKGVSLRIVRRFAEGVLLYVYRPVMLGRILAEPETAVFLTERGYPGDGWIETCLDILSARLTRDEGFPHEIGIFLGYPLEDVQGFIMYQGRQYSLCGFWKVYGDPGRAERLFARYRYCKSIYKRMFEGGSSVLQLTVPA